LAKGLNEAQVKEQNWKKVTSNPEIKFKDFANCDDLLTTAKMIDKTCSAAGKEDKASDSEEEVDKSPIPSSGEAVPRFEAV
jgi:hypothetical protein